MATIIARDCADIDRQELTVSGTAERDGSLVDNEALFMTCTNIRAIGLHAPACHRMTAVLLFVVGNLGYR